MYLSQPQKFLKTHHRISYTNKQNILPLAKFNVYPPKMQRVSSIGSGMYLESAISTSLSKQFKSFKDYSKNKNSILESKNAVNNSFNTNYDIGKYTHEFNTHRYSCNIDLDRNSDNPKSAGLLGASYERKTVDPDLQSRVKQLEDKMKKNQQNLKTYSQQMSHFKCQISSLSASNLHDSINTNNLIYSAGGVLKDLSNLQNYNKQSICKNVLTVESITNSPRQFQVQKNLKQINQLKKQVQKIKIRDESLRGDMKLFNIKTKEILTGFREYLSESIESIAKTQQKKNKKLSQKISKEMNLKFKEFISNSFEPLKTSLQNIKVELKKDACTTSITKSAQKFIRDPIMLKIKESAYCLVKRATKLFHFESYEDMIKRNIYESMGKPFQSPLQKYSFGLPRLQDENFNQSKVELEQIQTTYFLDEDGYLLDASGYYLMLDNQKIKLNELQIEKLKHNKILQCISTIGLNNFKNT